MSSCYYTKIQNEVLPKKKKKNEVLHTFTPHDQDNRDNKTASIARAKTDQLILAIWNTVLRRNLRLQEPQQDF